MPSKIHSYINESNIDLVHLVNNNNNNTDSSINIFWNNASIISGWKLNTKKTPIKALPNEFTDFILPFKGKLLRGYTSFHKAWNIKLKLGDSVKTCLDGKVRFAKFNSGGYGNLIIIRGFNGLEFFYGHLSKILVKENQIVNGGQIIGLGGATGYATCTHLHFEVRSFDHTLNISNIIDFKTGE